MAVVRAIQQPLNADRMVDDVEHAIRSGALAPSSELSLPELADRAAVRYPVLRELMGRLERDGLITVRGPSVLVTPLDADEFTRICRLRRAVEIDLFVRSCTEVTPKTLDRLAALIPEEVPPELPGTPGALKRWGQMMATISATLCGPAATPPELRVLEQCHLASHRYNSLGWAQMRQDGETPSSTSVQVRRQHLDAIRETVEGFRTRNPAIIRELAHRGQDNAYFTGSQSLVPAHLSRMPSSAAEWPRLRVVSSLTEDR